MITDASQRLATYGTLRPGAAYHDEVANLRGIWRKGTVRGRLHVTGHPAYPATDGYPVIALDDDAPPVEVDILESPDLPGHWARIDAFEGEGYRRVIADVQTEDGPLPASIYVLDA